MTSRTPITEADVIARCRRLGQPLPSGLTTRANRVEVGETRRRRDVEHQEQVKIIQWAELYKSKWPQLGFLAAVPNGGYRHLSVARKLKAEGVRSGYPDLVLNVPMGRYHGLFIELKAPKGRATTNQYDWIANLIRAGNAAVICFGADDAISTLKWYCSGADDGNVPLVSRIQGLIGENK
jgi:hypothetical protein